MALQTINVKLTGTAPLLMSNGRLVDPRDEYTKQIAVLDGLPKARRTEKTLEEADRLRWLGSVYADEEGYAVLPATNFEACLKFAGRIHKLGTKVQAGVYVEDDSRLDGVDRPISEIVDDPAYTHRINTKRGVMAHRPIFPNWGAEFTIHFDDMIISKDDVDLVLQTAGRTGVGSWAKRFGKFSVEVL
jgi:hypothetical protein